MIDLVDSELARLIDSQIPKTAGLAVLEDIYNLGRGNLTVKVTGRESGH